MEIRKIAVFSFVLKYSIAPKVVAPDQYPTTAKGNNCFKLFFIVNSSFIVYAITNLMQN